MKAKEFINRFFNGNFAKEHLYAHLSAGFPMPIRYENTLALKLRLHLLQCSEEQIVFSAPKYEVIVLYPSGRVAEYRPVNSNRGKAEAIISKKQIPVFQVTLESAYEALDELMAFYADNRVLPDVLLRKYEERMRELAPEIGFEDWYGGCDDSNSDN